jgi:hypothetical protein
VYLEVIYLVHLLHLLLLPIPQLLLPGSFSVCLLSISLYFYTAASTCTDIWFSFVVIILPRNILLLGGHRLIIIVT